MRGWERLLRPLSQRLQLMVGRALVQLVNDQVQIQALQIGMLADEVRDEVERFQSYGFTSHPIPGAEAIAVCVAGNRDHAVVIAVDDRRFRLRGLATGEVAIYTDEGDKIVLKRGGEIEVTASTKVTLVTPLVVCTGDLQVDGAIHAIGNIATDANVIADGDVRDQAGGKSMAGMRAVFNGHKNGTASLSTELM